MTRKQRRGVVITSSLAMLGLSVGIVLWALSEKVTFFFTPTELSQAAEKPGARFRLGGLVAQGSWQKNADGTSHFTVTDGANSVPVAYRGILPDLFREGQGVIAEGHMGEGGMFAADTVLAKHDEKYMPREVADALKKTGHWQGEHKANAAPKPGAPGS